MKLKRFNEELHPAFINRQKDSVDDIDLNVVIRGKANRTRLLRDIKELVKNYNDLRIEELIFRKYDENGKDITWKK